jgi:hypothetical protein
VQALAGSCLNRILGRCSEGALVLPLRLFQSQPRFNAFSAQQDWAGEYGDKNFLNGRAVFQMSVTQSGNAIQIVFDAAYNDAHGVAPDGEGQAKITDNNALAFKWKDSFKNSGTGTITCAGKDIVVSMNTTRVIDSRCLAFYGQNMRLKRAK